MEKNCPILQAQSKYNMPCMKEECAWWIKHDGQYGCAITKIVPELFELRKWLAMAQAWRDSK